MPAASVSGNRPGAAVSSPVTSTPSSPQPEGWAGSDLALLGGVGSGSVPTLEELMAAIAPGATDAGEWLAQAREMVRHFDAYGRIDDLVGYLQRYRLL